MQMLMRSNKYRFSSWRRKRGTSFKSENDPSNVAMLNIAVDSRSLFRRSAPRLLPRRDALVFDKVFQALLAEANRELASLLQKLGRCQTTPPFAALRARGLMRSLFAPFGVPRSSTCFRPNLATLQSPTNR